jgi:predicted HTH domain antitoxin
MNVAFEIPDEVSAPLQARWGDVAGHAREAVAVEAYRSGALTAYQAGKLLGHVSRWETEEFLKRMQAWLHYTEADLERDLLTLRQASGS